jgi:hypothetical protein
MPAWEKNKLVGDDPWMDTRVPHGTIQIEYVLRISAMRTCRACLHSALLTDTDWLLSDEVQNTGVA